MTCAPEEKMPTAQFYKELDEMIPKDLRKTMLEIEEHPLWLDIGDYLNSIPLREKVDRLKLIDDLSEKTSKDYYEIRDALVALEKEGYVYVRKRSKPDHFLAARFIEAMRIRRRIEIEILEPIIKAMKGDPELSSTKDLAKILKSALYCALR